MILSVIFYIFVVCTGIQIIYYLLFLSFLFGSKRKKNKGANNDPVSVLIYAKNQVKELQQLLPSILAQKHSEFEILIVNNASIDDTNDILEPIVAQHQNLRILNIENNEAFWGSKKYALTLAIKSAKHNNLLFIDASCNPVSKYWISEMNNQFSIKTTIVLGYKKYEKVNSVLNIYIRFENLLQAIKCFSFTKFKQPYMAFGHNFAYQKTEFFKVNGFINHMKINAGEDDLFIKDAATKKNTTFSIAANSLVTSIAPSSFSEWFSKKKEENNISKKYKFKHRFLLKIFTISKLLCYLLATILFFYYPYKIILPFVLCYILLQYIVVGLSAGRLKEPQIIFFLPFLEIGLILIQISIFIANSIAKPNH